MESHALSWLGHRQDSVRLVRDGSIQYVGDCEKPTISGREMSEKTMNIVVCSEGSGADEKTQK